MQQGEMVFQNTRRRDPNREIDDETRERIEKRRKKKKKGGDAKYYVAGAAAAAAATAAAGVGGAAIKDGVTFVDIRDIRELWRDGAVPGAWHVPRGMLEFWLDPDSPYAKERFQTGDKFVFFCAGGMRSALAALAAQDMGLENVAHINDGFGGWKKAGGAIEEKEKK